MSSDNTAFRDLTKLYEKLIISAKHKTKVEDDFRYELVGISKDKFDQFQSTITEYVNKLTLELFDSIPKVVNNIYDPNIIIEYEFDCTLTHLADMHKLINVDETLCKKNSYITIDIVHAINDIMRCKFIKLNQQHYLEHPSYNKRNSVTFSFEFKEDKYSSFEDEHDIHIKVCIIRDDRQIAHVKFGKIDYHGWGDYGIDIDKTKIKQMMRHTDLSDVKMITFKCDDPPVRKVWVYTPEHQEIFTHNLLGNVFDDMVGYCSAINPIIIKE